MGSKIKIGVCILDMWSVVYALHIWVVAFSIMIGLDILDMWSVLCSTCGWLGLVW